MQDKVLKVWDVAGEAPVFVTERDIKLGELHDCAPCPDAPFVMVMGGDKTSDNLKVGVNIIKGTKVTPHFETKSATLTCPGDYLYKCIFSKDP